ncbi:MAG: hypothetical protein OEY23_00255 [Acidimicrobiia bacterium]|nr:hypothetical protein [Acidimicrobiia bacterium]
MCSVCFGSAQVLPVAVIGLRAAWVQRRRSRHAEGGAAAVEEVVARSGEPRAREPVRAAPR